MKFKPRARAGERACAECGKIFYANMATKKFCSIPCQRANVKRREKEERRRRSAENPRYCPCCGEVVPYGQRIYCSKACQREMKRKESVQLESEKVAKRIKKMEPGIEARAKELGMTYGQYRAIEDKDPAYIKNIAEKYYTTAYSAGGWLGSKTVEIGQLPPGGPAKIKAHVKKCIAASTNNQ